MIWPPYHFAKPETEDAAVIDYCGAEDDEEKK